MIVARVDVSIRFRVDLAALSAEWTDLKGTLVSHLADAFHAIQQRTSGKDYARGPGAEEATTDDFVNVLWTGEHHTVPEFQRRSLESFLRDALQEARNHKPLVTPPKRPSAIKPKTKFVQFEPDVVEGIPDEIVDSPPPFEGKTVLALRGNPYASVRSRRFARSSDAGRALRLGKHLFGATSWVIAARLIGRTKVYYVASLDREIGERDLQLVPLTGANVPEGASAVISGEVLRTLGDFEVQSVFVAGGRAAPTPQTFAEFAQEVRESERAGLARPALELIRQRIFEPIDRLLAAGCVQEAADQLAELTEVAFGTLTWSERTRYLEVLLDAWTLEEHERAVVEIIKSIPGSSRSELDAVFERLKKTDHWQQLFGDLNSQLWSLLATLGAKFGDPSPVTFDSFVQMLLNARLVSLAPGVRLGPNGPEISPDGLIALNEAAMTFLHFIGDFFAGIAQMISHPDVVVEGLANLVRMLVIVELARYGDRDAQAKVAAALKQIGKQILAVFKGTAIAGVGPRVVQRITWSVIWEVASLFVGVGELKAAATALGLSERLAAVAQFLRALGRTGRLLEEEAFAARVGRLATAMSKSSAVLGSEERALQLLSHLPDSQLRRLANAVERSGAELDLLRAESSVAGLVDKELAAAAADSLGHAERLERFATKAGALGDDVVSAYARLSSRPDLSAEQLSRLIDAIPESHGARFARAVDHILADEAVRAPVGALEALASDPGRTNVLATIGPRPFLSLYQRSAGDVAKLDEYVAALAHIQERMPPADRAVRFQQFLDDLANSDAGASWLLEHARTGRLESVAADSAVTRTADAAGEGAVDSLQTIDDLIRDDIEPFTDEELNPENWETPQVTGGEKPRIEGRRVPTERGRILDMEDIARLPGETATQALQRVETIIGKKISETQFLNAWNDARSAILRGRNIEDLGREATIKIYENVRNAFWRRVGDRPDLIEFLNQAGFDFRKGRAPMLRVEPGALDPRPIPAGQMRISLDHSAEKALDQNWRRALDADNLDFDFAEPNSFRETVQSRHRLRIPESQ